MDWMGGDVGSWLQRFQTQGHCGASNESTVLQLGPDFGLGF